MKKILALCLSLVTIFSLTACGNTENANDTSDVENDSVNEVIDEDTETDDSDITELEVDYANGTITNNIYGYKFTLPEALANGCDVIASNPGYIDIVVKGDFDAKVMSIEARKTDDSAIEDGLLDPDGEVIEAPDSDNLPSDGDTYNDEAYNLPSIGGASDAIIDDGITDLNDAAIASELTDSNDTADTNSIVSDDSMSVDTDVISFEYAYCGENHEYAIWLHITTSVNDDYDGDKEAYQALIDSANMDISADNFISLSDIVDVDSLTGLKHVIAASRNEAENIHYDLFIIGDETSDVYLGNYGINVDSMTDYCASFSFMNTKAYMVLVAKAADGKIDDVISGMESFVEATKQSFEFYLPDQFAIASDAVVQKQGEYAILVMCEDADTVVKNIVKELNNME